MRRLRSPLLFLLLLLILLGLGAHSSAQAPGDPASNPEGPGRSGGSEETLSTFEPSEEVSADVAVAFPVDI